MRAKPAPRVILRCWHYSLVVCISVATAHIVLPTIVHIIQVWSLCRPAEVRGLCWADIETLPDERAVICIDYSKTSGRRLNSESVTLDDPFVVYLLARGKEAATSELVWPFPNTYFEKRF